MVSQNKYGKMSLQMILRIVYVVTSLSLECFTRGRRDTGDVHKHRKAFHM